MPNMLNLFSGGAVGSIVWLDATAEITPDSADIICTNDGGNK